MNSITNEQRDMALATTSDEVREKYGAPTTGQSLWQIAERHALTQDTTYRDFAITVGDVILGLRSQTELPAVLAATFNLSTGDAVKVTADIIDFLGAEKQSDLSSDIAEVESALQAIPKVRTMASDAHRAQAGEVTHSSTQEALLRPQTNPNPPPQ